MSQIILKDDGSEVEVFTADEIEAQRSAAIEEYKVANPDKTVEVTGLQETLKTALEDLDKLKGKDLNFNNLRTAKEKAEADVKALKEEIDLKIGAAKKEILEGVMVDHYNDTVKALAGDDVELKKKIEFQYKRLVDSASTKEEVTKKLTDAWVLASKKEDGGAFNTTVISSGGVGNINARSDKKFSPEEKAFAQKLAESAGLKLEEADFNK